MYETPRDLAFAAQQAVRALMPSPRLVNSPEVQAGEPRTTGVNRSLLSEAGRVSAPLH